jgi:hypothetical protein
VPIPKRQTPVFDLVNVGATDSDLVRGDPGGVGNNGIAQQSSLAASTRVMKSRCRAKTSGFARILRTIAR